MNNNIEKKEEALGKKITRKQAIKKAGITALTAATLTFLETKNAAASSTEPTAPGWGT